VLYTASTTGSNDRDSDSFFDMLDQLNIKTAIGTILLIIVDTNAR
jgi:hypothetical protein